jgi:hypothetical protein
MLILMVAFMTAIIYAVHTNAHCGTRGFSHIVVDHDVRIRMERSFEAFLTPMGQHIKNESRGQMTGNDSKKNPRDQHVRGALLASDLHHGPSAERANQEESLRDLKSEIAQVNHVRNPAPGLSPPWEHRKATPVSARSGWEYVRNAHG